MKKIKWLFLLTFSILFISACGRKDKQDATRLEEIDKQVQTLYNKEKNDLHSEISQETLETISEEIVAEDEEDLSEENQTKLEEIIISYQQAAKMFALETDIKDIFEGENLILKQAIAEKDIENFEELLYKMDEEKFSPFIKRQKQMIEEAQAQLKVINQANKLITKLFDEDEVRESASRDEEKEATEVVNKIKNEAVRKELQEKLEKVDVALTKYEEEQAEREKEEARKKEEERLAKEKEAKEKEQAEAKANPSESADANKGKNNTASESNEASTSSKDLVVDGVKLTSVDGNNQVMLVTANGMNTNRGRLRTFEKDGNGHWKQLIDTTAHLGKNGLASNKTEGDGKSPTGKYSIGHAFGYNGNPGTKLNFKSTQKNDVWVDDPSSKYYNSWQSDTNADKDWNSAESMMHRLYTYGFVINYNTAQTPGKGSAIFMHVGNSYTLGCTALAQGDLLNVMRWVDPAKNPTIIQTPTSNLSSY